LTRNLVPKFDEVHDEIIQAFNELVPANEKGKSHFTSINSTSAVTQLSENNRLVNHSGTGHRATNRVQN
jgi:hypothetical protein